MLEAAAGGRQAGRRRAVGDVLRSPRLSRRKRGGVRRDAGGAGGTVCGGALVGAARPARSRPAGADAGPGARSRRPAGRVGPPRGVRQRRARNRTGAGRHVAAVGPHEGGVAVVVTNPERDRQNDRRAGADAGGAGRLPPIDAARHRIDAARALDGASSAATSCGLSAHPKTWTGRAAGSGSWSATCREPTWRFSPAGSAPASCSA